MSTRYRPSQDKFKNEKLSAYQETALRQFGTPQSLEEIKSIKQTTMQSLLYQGWVIRNGRGQYVRSAEGDQVLYDREHANIMRKNASDFLCAFLRERSKTERIVPFRKHKVMAA